MGIGFYEMQDMEWREYFYIAQGHEKRMQRRWDEVRSLMAQMHNTSGFAKSAIKPTDVMKLPLLDRETVKTKIDRVPKKNLERMLKHLK